MKQCETMKSNVAYLGPEGSFSHIAAFLHVENVPLEQLGGLLKSMQSIREVFEAVENGDCRWGIVPYENSLAGNIAETLDAFDRFQVNICGEVYVPVNHALMALSAELDIERIYSKYEVFGQCHNWLQKNMPGVEQVPVASTAQAARLAKHDDKGAAIGSMLAAKYFELEVLDYNLSGEANNFTRFLVIAKEPAELTEDDKTTIRFSTTDEPGALVNVLKIFCVLDLNLTHIVLVPSALSQNRLFFVDFEREEQKQITLLSCLTANGIAFEVLGSYPKADDLL